MNNFKRFWQQLWCRHHMHERLNDASLTGEVVCCQCGRVDDLGAWVMDAIHTPPVDL